MSPKVPQQNSKEQKKLPELRPDIVPESLRDELLDELKDIINTKNVPKVVDRVVAVLAQHTYNESKLPSAHELLALEEAYPGGAQIAIEMAQREQEMIISEIKKNNSRGFLLDFVAPICGLVGLGLLTALCAYMVSQGYATQAVVAAIGVIGTVVSLFLKMSRPSNSQPESPEKVKSPKK